MKNSLRTSLLLICVGVVAAIALIEVLARAAPILLPPSLRMIDRVYEARHAWEDMMVKDAYLGFKLKPGLDFEFPSEGRKVAVRTVDYGLGDIGFRDIGTKPPFTMIAVGDSFAFCDDAPVESCWVRRLADDAGMPMGTLGVNGYSSIAEARVLERYGPVFKPKVILLSVFLNDFKDNVNFDRWLSSGTDDFWLWMRRRRRGAISDRLTRASAVYRLIDGAQRFRRKPVHHFKEGNLDFVFRANPWWVGLVKAPDERRGWKLMQRAFDDMRETSKKIGAKLVVLLFPFKEQVYWEQIQGLIPESSSLDVDAPFKAIARYCEGHGLLCCDLTDGFRQEAEKGRQLYLRVSGHWNDAGHAVAADLVGRCLKQGEVLGHRAETQMASDAAGIGVRGRARK